MADDDATPLGTAAHESIINGDFKDAEALLVRAKAAAHAGGLKRANNIAEMLEQYVSEIKDAYAVSAALCARLSANEARHCAEMARKDAKIKSLQAEVVRLATVAAAASTAATIAAASSPPPSGSTSPQSRPRGKPPPVPGEDLCDSEDESFGDSNDGDEGHGGNAHSGLPARSPALDRLLPGTGGETPPQPLRSLSRVLANTPEHTPPPAVPARRVRTKRAAGADGGGSGGDGDGELAHARAERSPSLAAQKNAAVLSGAVRAFQVATRTFTSKARQVAQQHVVGSLADDLKVQTAKAICSYHLMFTAALDSVDEAPALLQLLSDANTKFRELYAALLPHTIVLAEVVGNKMDGNASDTFLELYRDFLEEAECFAADAWQRQCRALLDTVLPMLQELDEEAGLSPTGSPLDGAGLVADKQRLLQSIHATTRSMQKTLNTAKSDQVCRAIPALNDVLRQSRMRLQCDDMVFEKPAQESGYRIGFFKRGPQQVDVACCLFDGFFVAIEAAGQDGTVEALVVPTVGDLAVSIRQHKPGSLVLDSRDAFVIRGHQDAAAAQQFVGKREPAAGHQFLFSFKPGAMMRSSTALVAAARVSIPTPAASLQLWEREVTECTFLQNSTLDLVGRMLPWVAAGHLKHIKGVLKNREGLWRIFNTHDVHGQLALVAAAKAGSMEVTQYLLEEGADVNLATTGGATAFLEAAERGDVRMLGLLLSYGADPMAQDHDGRSGLEVLRFNHVGRYVNFYRDVMDENASDPARLRELKVAFETANARFDTRMRTLDPNEVPSHFTVPLTESALTPVQNYSTNIPSILVLLRTLFNEAGGVTKEGVFRLSPDETKAKHAKQDMVSNVFLDRNGVSHKYIRDIDVLASLIKQYLRDLPEPIVWADEIVVSAGSKAPVEPVEFWSRMTKKGKLYRETLRYVVDIAADVAAQESQNQMSPQNMGIVFAPNVIRVEESVAEADPQRAFAASKIANAFFEALVEERLAERARRCRR